MAGSGIYSATKVALKSFTESCGKELGRRGVTVNTVTPARRVPGMMDTAPEGALSFSKGITLRRIGRAVEIAQWCLPGFAEASWGPARIYLPMGLPTPEIFGCSTAEGTSACPAASDRPQLAQSRMF